jgi:phosphoglycolate phosphatase
MLNNGKKYTHIIWDWNGTLLDDAWLCVDVMNGMLKEYNLPLATLEYYRSIFEFPVRDYYEKLGFDFSKEPFEKVGMEFMVHYNERQKEASLHKEVLDILEFLHRKGYRQSILSAREQNELRQETVEMGVAPYFSKVYGLNDHYAHGKTDVGKRLLKALGQPKNEFLFIGDTLHDADVAAELEIDCILVPNGHHSYERLAGSGVPVVDSIRKIMDML